MLYSMISRHPIVSYFHQLNFFIHDILMPCFFISLGSQFISYFDKMHVYNGLMLCLFFVPLFFINGMLLSSFISNQSYAYLFKNYGIHFLITTMEIYYTGFHKKFIKCLYYIHIYLVFSNMYILLYLLFNLQQSKFYLDFFICLYPLPSLNIMNIKSHHNRNVKKHHVLNAYILTYLSMLGVFFSTSIDSYWIFSKTQPLIVRLIIQNIPLTIFLFHLPNLF